MAMTVKLQYENGEAITGVEVTVWLDYERGQAKSSTDGSGKAYFSFEPGSGTIYVNGSEARKGSLSSYEVITHHPGRGYS